MTDENAMVSNEENLPVIESQDRDIFFLDNIQSLADALVEVASIDKKKAEYTYEYIKARIQAIDREYEVALQEYEVALSEYLIDLKLVQDKKLHKNDAKVKPIKPQRPKVSDYLQELNKALAISVDSTDKLVKLTDIYSKIFVKQVNKKGVLKTPEGEPKNLTQINVENL